VDIDTTSRVTIGAAANGVVTFAGSKGGYGLLVLIKHPSGISTAYAHQSRIRVRKGQRVLRGQRVGYVGSTGHSTGSHLHFEVRRGKTQLDPIKHLAMGRRGMPQSPAFF
jgi:murein DD-endopeptidase MepM/ murein hydrolase activator NlpD